jgi:hypothetical protein
MTAIVDLRKGLYTICPLGFMDLITEPEMFCGYCGIELLDWLHQCSVCDPAKIFLASKISYFFFFQPHP